jgi:hypothetical protein
LSKKKPITVFEGGDGISGISTKKAYAASTLSREEARHQPACTVLAYSIRRQYRRAEQVASSADLTAPNAPPAARAPRTVERRACSMGLAP